MIKRPEVTGYKIEVDTDFGDFTYDYTIAEFEDGEVIEDYHDLIGESSSKIVNVMVVFDDGSETILQSSFQR